MGSRRRANHRKKVSYTFSHFTAPMKKTALIFFILLITLINVAFGQKAGVYIVDSLSKVPVQFAVIQSFEREISFLKGRIFNDELRRTRVTFTVRPNSIFLIFFLLFPAIGVFALTSDDIEGDIDKIRFIGFIFIFVVPALMLLFGHLAKQGIKNRFIATFKLKPLSNRKEG